MSTSGHTITRYGEWLPYLSEADRAYVKRWHVEVRELCAEDPTRPRWVEYLTRWTLAALDAEDPAAALADAVAATAGDPHEINQALAELDKIADRWEARYKPRTKIVGEPYPLNER